MYTMITSLIKKFHFHFQQHNNIGVIEISALWFQQTTPLPGCTGFITYCTGFVHLTKGRGPFLEQGQTWILYKVRKKSVLFAK